MIKDPKISVTCSSALLAELLMIQTALASSRSGALKALSANKASELRQLILDVSVARRNMPAAKILGFDIGPNDSLLAQRPHDPE